MEDLQKDKDQGEKLRSLVEMSRKNDIPALLNAKNRAQQDVYSDPSKENLAVLERATAMLEKAMDAGQNCKNWKEALTYLQEDCGRKIGQTKLFADIKAGRLRKQPDGRDAGQAGHRRRQTAAGKGRTGNPQDTGRGGQGRVHPQGQAGPVHLAG